MNPQILTRKNSLLLNPYATLSYQKLGIIYRDIKLENILLDPQGHIVLTDFGLCKKFQANEKVMRTFSFCGTIEYMSPELIKGGAEGHDFSVDWWSVGVLTYELLTGASPFTVDGERNTQAEISKRILKDQPPIPDHLSAHARDFIRRLLVKEPLKRLGGGQSDAAQLKSHPFLATINWSLLAQRKLKAPFKPKIKHELDVSNFAEEFTSMAPHVLVGARSNNPHDQSQATNLGSNNETNGSNMDTVDEEDDDYYESEDDESDDCIGGNYFDRSERVKPELMTAEQKKNSLDDDDEEDEEDYDDFDDGEVEDDYDHIDSQDDERRIVGGNATDFGQTSTANKLSSTNLMVHEINGLLMTIRQSRNQQQLNQKVSTGNQSVIQQQGVIYGCNSNNRSQQQQVFSMLTPSKHQLSFSLLARQQQQLDKKHQMHNTNDNTHCNLSSLTPSAIIQKQFEQRSYQKQQQQQQELFVNGVHYSKLFKGYSYMNPKAIEWYKQQDMKTFSPLRRTQKFYHEQGTIRQETSSLYSRPAKRQCAQILDHSTYQEGDGMNLSACKGAKAIPVEMLIDQPSEEEETKEALRSTSESPKTLRVAFTIGDGEDLATAIRSADIANRSEPERLIVYKRKYDAWNYC